MNVLITGAASGIGLAASEYFLKKGHTVYGIDAKGSEEREGFIGIVADVTDSEALSEIGNKLTESGVMLDVIVCVAGIHAMASLVEDDYVKIKRVIDVNLLGTMAVCRVFHKHLVPKGRIVIVTSEVATYDPMPFNGLYTVSKTALDSYAQALRQELNLIGQRVITVRPGAVETPLAKESGNATAELAERTELYRKQAKHFSHLVARFTGKPMCPRCIAALIHKAATKKRVRLDYSINRHPGLVLLSILPRRLQCFVIKTLLNRK